MIGQMRKYSAVIGPLLSGQSHHWGAQGEAAQAQAGGPRGEELSFIKLGFML